jgi:sensor histidine kinase YesM
MSKRVIVTYSIISFVSLVAFIFRAVTLEGMSVVLNLQLFFLMVFVVSFVWEYFRYLNRRLSKKFPLDSSPFRRISIQVILGVIVLYAVRGTGFWVVKEYSGYEPDWMFKISIFVVDFLVVATVNLIFFAREYFRNWKESIQRAERLEKEKTQVQFDNLKNHLNPHFLFNALTSLNSLIYSNQALASSFLQHMSRVYRYLLQNRHRDLVSLQTEMDFIENYIFLVQTRFDGAVDISADISPEKNEMGIVPVTLQVLIENALKHNIISAAKPLRIRIETRGDELLVINNIQRKNIVESSNKLGLENLKNLYRFLCPGQVQVNDDGTTFTVQIPLIQL